MNKIFLGNAPITAAVDGGKSGMVHRDGEPFYWMGDTWWMGLTTRLDWPAGFHALTVDRVEKGFSVIQIVAGLYPDMDPFDERGANDVVPGVRRGGPPALAAWMAESDNTLIIPARG